MQGRKHRLHVTTMRISNLPEEFSGPQRNDTLGVPLLDCDCIWTIWESEQDIAYLQDPEVVQLYTKTSKIVKGGRELPLYCCSRGSTCHNHLDFFIPGMLIVYFFYEIRYNYFLNMYVKIVKSCQKKMYAKNKFSLLLFLLSVLKNFISLCHHQYL